MMKRLSFCKGIVELLNEKSKRENAETSGEIVQSEKSVYEKLSKAMKRNKKFALQGLAN